jgi:hypothetical protein
LVGPVGEAGSDTTQISAKRHSVCAIMHGRNSGSSTRVRSQRRSPAYRVLVRRACTGCQPALLRPSLALAWFLARQLPQPSSRNSGTKRRSRSACFAPCWLGRSRSLTCHVALHLGIQFRPYQDDVGGHIEPEQQDDYRAERSICLVVASDRGNIETEHDRTDEP